MLQKFFVPNTQLLIPNSQPLVMGILNITPDSFSDGGKWNTPDAALKHAQQMVAEGAAIIDVGGESTRPNATPVSLQEELDRVIPVVQKLAQNINIPISIDTYKPRVMEEAIKAGACFINDINALQDEAALAVAVRYQIPVCIMHKRGTPQTMQQNLHYDDVIAEVYQFLAARIHACLNAGITKENIIVDPGFGFGKGTEDDLRIINHLGKFKELSVPILIGVSRKKAIGALLGVPATERLPASLALTILAVERGAAIIRAHDVGPTVQALKVLTAMKMAEAEILE